MSDRPTCSTCPYWDDTWDKEIAQGVLDPAYAPDSDTIVKQCRRFPPARTNLDKFLGAGHDARASDLLNLGYGNQGVWLHTEGGDWCGEHPDFPAWIRARSVATPDSPL